MQQNDASRRIHILRDSEARKIAAGEVIDRPFSVVRELLDNSIDAGASEISVYLEEGGVGRIRVLDDGTGMSAGDLELCVLAHATSKIEKTEDIYSVKTLGFRGEALSSIAACSKLLISSTDYRTPDTGHSIQIHDGKKLSFSEAPPQKGTVVDVGDLFYSLPGRRKFLKRPSTETLLCRQALIDKALPFPNITFRYFVDNTLKLFLPQTTRKERIATAFAGQLDPAILHSAERDFGQYSIRAVLADPAYSRRDRRLVQVFINNRRVQEYSLIQAATYGYSEYLPGGAFPAAFLFIDVDPRLVDFNIHPAKREVRIRNAAEVHRGTVSVLRAKLAELNVQPRQETPVTQESLHFPAASYAEPGLTPRRKPYDMDSVRESIRSLEAHDSAEDLQPQPANSEDLRYLGRLFNLFILVEQRDTLFIIDQHAAHERIIYERICSEPPRVQSLLVPIQFELDTDQEGMLEKDLETYRRFGIQLCQRGKGIWELDGCPEICMRIKDELIEFISGQKGDSTALEQELFSVIACRAAVMDGEVLDPITAIQLAREAFGLSNPRCPHGRPIWHKITKDMLYELVGRTV